MSSGVKPQEVRRTKHKLSVGWWASFACLKPLKLPSTKVPSMEGCAALGQLPKRDGGAAIPGDVQMLSGQCPELSRSYI